MPYCVSLPGLGVRSLVFCCHFLLLKSTGVSKRSVRTICYWIKFGRCQSDWYSPLPSELCRGYSLHFQHCGHWKRIWCKFAFTELLDLAHFLDYQQILQYWQYWQYWQQCCFTKHSSSTVWWKVGCLAIALILIVHPLVLFSNKVHESTCCLCFETILSNSSFNFKWFPWFQMLPVLWNGAWAFCIG